MCDCTVNKENRLADSDYANLVFTNVVLELLDEKEFVTRSDILIALEDRKLNGMLVHNMACDFAIELLDAVTELDAQ